MEAMIDTQRLRLRPLEQRDADRIVEFASDLEVAKMLAEVPYPYTHEDAQNFLRRVYDAANAQTALVCAIDRYGLIGVAGLSCIQSIEGGTIATLGYWLGRPYWGRGYATEAVRALVAHGFQKLSLAGLKSGHFKDNHRSGHVLAKNGFRYAGEGPRPCLARGDDIAHVDVVLTRAQWEEFTARRAA